MTPRWIERLQLSPRTERALTEAVLDGRHEAVGARTAPARMRARLATFVAVLRAMLMSMPGEARALGSTYWLWAIPLSVTVLVLLPWVLQRDFGMFDMPNVRSLAWVQLARASAMALPSVAFLAVVFARRNQHVPTLLVIAAFSATAVLMMAVVVPAAWSHYAEVGLLRPAFEPGVPPIAQVPALILRLVFAILLANRVRVDPRRWSLLLIPIVGFIVVTGGALFAILTSARNPLLSNALYQQTPPTVALVASMLLTFLFQAVRLIVDLVPFPFMSALLWFLLVKRQERMTRAEELQLLR